MKKISIFLILLLIVSCKSKTPNTIPNKTAEIKKEVIEYKRFVPITAANVTVIKKNRAYELGTRLLETCNTSRFKSFNSQEATESVIKNATVDKITKTCQKINSRNGKFIDLTLLEIIQDNETGDFIFRYYIQYQKKYYNRELKIIVNKDNKVSSISTKEILKN